MNEATERAKALRKLGKSAQSVEERAEKDAHDRSERISRKREEVRAKILNFGKG